MFAWTAMTRIATAVAAFCAVACWGDLGGPPTTGTPSTTSRDRRTDSPPPGGTTEPPPPPKNATVQEPAPAPSPSGTVHDIEGHPIAFEAPHPNVMLLVDRSGSMTEPGLCAQSSCPSKWQQLLALGGYLGEVKQRARLGLAYFPSPRFSGCSVEDGLAVPISDAPDVDAQILGSLGSTHPGGSTPAAAALDEIAEVGGLDDPERDNAVVLLTDGKPNCACGGDPVCETETAVAAVEALVHRDPPVKVFVIGFGTSARDAAAETLTKMAQAAGTARDVSGQPAYYQADTVEDLVRLLYDVTRQIQPCEFELAQAPAPDQLVVALDGQELPSCADACDQGYRYDAPRRRVRFLGASCDRLRDGQVHEVWFAAR